MSCCPQIPHYKTNHRKLVPATEVLNFSNKPLVKEEEQKKKLDYISSSRREGRHKSNLKKTNETEKNHKKDEQPKGKENSNVENKD